ncbi:MAG: hypothetical protein AAFR68_04150 [Pseudomonadota bacterium]
MTKWDWLGVAFLTLALTWTAFPSDRFVEPVALTYDRDADEFTFTRRIHFGQAHHGRWVTEIAVIDPQGHECPSGVPRHALYQRRPGDTVTYRLDAWAQPCLSSGLPMIITTKRTVLLWGWFPLRPSTNTTKIDGPLK